MTKQKIIEIGRRSCVLKGIGIIISESDDQAAKEGWNSLTDYRSYPDIAADDNAYRECCQFFDRIDRTKLWGFEP